jgi:hypothetical protein
MMSREYERVIPMTINHHDALEDGTSLFLV